jgi:hypothetical protein
MGYASSSRAIQQRSHSGLRLYRQPRLLYDRHQKPMGILEGCLKDSDVSTSYDLA